MACSISILVCVCIPLRSLLSASFMVWLIVDCAWLCMCVCLCVSGCLSIYVLPQIWATHQVTECPVTFHYPLRTDLPMNSYRSGTRYWKRLEDSRWKDGARRWWQPGWKLSWAWPSTLEHALTISRVVACCWVWLIVRSRRPWKWTTSCIAANCAWQLNNRKIQTLCKIIEQITCTVRKISTVKVLFCSAVLV